MERADVLIAGGGIIGSAVAWALARRGFGGIAVVDLDLAGHYASSELNAGGARATWWQPVNSFTERGVMQSYGIATALAEAVATGRSSEIDLAPLSRDRFRDTERWVMEDLHI
jgi:glycine/D-amino acid oxidase-like deaminating enzyme